MGLRFIVTACEGTVAGTYMDVVLEADSVVIGRGQVDLVLPDPSVSLRHLEVRVAEEGWTIEDLDSRLGTRLNGRRIEQGRALPLRAQDKIEVGTFCLVFEGELEQALVENTRVAARSLVRRLEQGAGAQRCLPYLEVQNGPAAGVRFDLDAEAKLKMGRGRDCELMVDDARISRVHALIHHRGGAVWLKDAGSANGSYLDGEPVRGLARLENGSQVRVGGVRLLLVLPERRWLGFTTLLDAIPGEGLPATLSVIAALLLGGLGLLIGVML